MAAASHPDVVVHEGHDPDVDRVKKYVIIAAILAVLTGIEVALSYMKDVPHAVVVGGLGVLMVLKFGTVTAYFMHLKFDKRFLTVVFYSGLVLALMIYLAILAAFRFFTPEHHMIPGLITLF